MDIRILGAHNCESASTRLSSLMVGGVLSLDGGALASGLSFAEQRKIKSILLTHHHYDHVKDVPAVLFNFAMWEEDVNVYSTSLVYQKLTAHLLNGELYPKFLGWPSENPRINFNLVEPYQSRQIEGYNVLPVPVRHSVPTVGYQVISPDGKSLFYTGDTGPGLSDCWEHISPQLLIIELSAPNRFEKLYRKRGHLTPNLLRQELSEFLRIKGYLPQVVLVHLNPNLEAEIKGEIDIVAAELNHEIRLAYEDMELHL
ncbi:MBL fold metallo-hydrolase [Chloroflexota bacterium]